MGKGGERRNNARQKKCKEGVAAELPRKKTNKQTNSQRASLFTSLDVYLRSTLETKKKKKRRKKYWCIISLISNENDTLNCMTQKMEKVPMAILLYTARSRHQHLLGKKDDACDCFIALGLILGHYANHTLRKKERGIERNRCTNTHIQDR